MGEIGEKERAACPPAGPLLPLVDDVFGGGGGGGSGVGVARRVISDAWDAPLSRSLGNVLFIPRFNGGQILKIRGNKAAFNRA